MAERVYGTWTITDDRGVDALGTVHLAKGPGGQIAVLHVLEERYHTPAASGILRETLARAQLLSHPNVVAIRGFADGREGPAWIAEEHIGGVTLASLLDMNVKLLWTSAAMVLHEVTAAVSYAIRQGVIHGGLTPANIVLSQDGRVKVRGFGLSRLTDGSVEQGEARMVTPREDLRAIGRLAHDMVVGASFGQKDPDQLEQDVEGLGLPDGYREILRLASRSAQSELVSTQQVLAHLRTLLNGAGLNDLEGGLKHTFEELSFFFLVAGGASQDAARQETAAPGGPPARAGGSPSRVAPLPTDRAGQSQAGPLPTDRGGSQVAPLPADRDASQAGPPVDVDGGARTAVLNRPAGLLNDLLEDPISVDSPTVVGVQPKGDAEAPRDPTVWLGGDEGAESDDEPPVTEEIVVAPPDAAARRVVGAEFERVAEGTSRVVWVVVALLAVALVAIGIVVTRSVMSNSQATREVVTEEEPPGPAVPPGAEAAEPDATVGQGEPVVEPPVVKPKEPAVPEPPPRDPAVVRAEAEAASLMAAGKPVAARDLLEAARTKAPDDALLALGVARTMIATQSWSDAGRVLNEAIRLDRELTEAYVLLGQVQMQTGNAAGAVDAMRHVLDRKGGDADFLLALGGALGAKGEHEGAVPILMQALQLRKDFPHAQLLLGRSYEKLRDTPKAIEAYKAAAVDRELAEESLLRVVDLMEKRGQLKQALDLLQERLNADPEFAILYLVLGDVEYREHRFTEARAHLVRYLELVPGAVSARLVLGNVLFHLRDPKGAAAMYGAALALAPGDGRAAHNLGMAQLAEGDVGAAQETFTAAVAAGNEVWQTRCELGRIRHKAHHLVEARDLYKSALAKKPDHPWLGKMVALPMDSGQAEILMSRPCDDREIVEVSLDRPGR